MERKVKLTELNRLDDLEQRELLKITGGAAPSSGCCCSCDSCTCTDDSCNENDKKIDSYDLKNGTCVSVGVRDGSAV